MSLSLTYMNDLSRVRIAGSGLPDGSVTVERSLNGLLWSTVRGGIAVPVIDGSFILDDYEFAPEVENIYRVSAAVAETLDVPSDDQINGDPWVVPSGVTTLEMACTGAGGTGRNPGTTACAGAGGGAWAGSTLTVTPGETLRVLVGKSGYNGVDGNRSGVGRSGTALVAAPGGRGPVTSSMPGLGGDTADAVGDVVYAGGDGGARESSSTAGGGGGASASPTGPGEDGAAGAAGVGGAGGTGNADTVTLPTITDTVSAVSATADPWTIDAPEGDLDGQVLLLLHASDGGTLAGMGTPTGGAPWTLLYEIGDMWGAPVGAARLWWKVAGPAEPTEYGLSQDGTNNLAIVTAVSGVATDAMASDAIVLASGSGTGVGTPAVALAAPGGIDIRIGSTIVNSDDMTAPAGWFMLAHERSGFTHGGVAARTLSPSAGSEQSFTMGAATTYGRLGVTVTLPGVEISGGDGGNGPGGAGGDTGSSGENGGHPGGGGGGRGGGVDQVLSGVGAHGQVVLSSWGGSEETGTVTPSLDGKAWLKSIKHPFLNRAIHRVLAGGGQSIGRAARGTLHDVQGRSMPVATTDVRSSREFTLTVQVPDEESARDMDLVLASGDIFYIQIPPELAPHMTGGYVRIGDTEQYREADTIMWRFVLPCTVVTPPGPGVVGTTLTWGTVLRLYGSWEALIASNPTWSDLLATVASPDDLVVL